MKFPEEANCMFICYARGPEEYQLYVHLHCPGLRRIPTVCSSAMPGAVPDNARDSAGLSIAPTGAEVTNVAGVAGFLSGSIVPRGASIMPSGASGKFHANRHIELTGLDQTAEEFGPGGRAWRMGLGNGPGEWNLPRYGALAWKVQLWSSNCPRYRHQPWKVQLLNPEPSVICVFIADGCFVYIELSVIQA